MKNFQNLYLECMQELRDIGIEHGCVSKWEINTRAKKRWGQCESLGHGYYSINISVRLLADEVDDIATKTTILHELLHTCDGCMNHGKEWLRLANKVNRAYGYNIKRTTSWEEKGIDKPDEIKPKYAIACPCCGTTWNYIRMTKAVQFPNLYRCGKCGVDLVRVK